MLLPVTFRGTRLLASRLSSFALRLRRGTLLPILALGLAGAGHAATLIVTTTADSGAGSLRAALAASRADGSGDVIIFDPVVFAARQTISVTGPILFATAGVTIHGPAVGVTLDGSQVPASSGRLGLAFESDTATSSISNLTIQNFGGSGLSNRFGTVTATHCVIQGNITGNGGGVFNDGTMTLLGCTVAGNTAQSGAGGGIFSYGTLTLTGCTLSGNTSSGPGGGIYNGSLSAAALTLTDCTVTGNTAGRSGGGGISNLSGVLSAVNCTFTGNQATTNDNVYGGGGAIAIVRGTTTLTNDIFYGDTSPQGGGDEIFFDNNGSPGTVTINHCDLNPATVYGAAYTDGGGSFSADPRLGPLQNNGGSTQTRALLPGSPCIDAGTSIGAPATDQRGAARVGATDIGAYEYGSIPSASGHTHLLWNNTDGRVMLWSIASDGSFTLNGFGPYTDNAPQNKWSATAVATGPDGKSHLLWNNTDGRVMLWTVDDSGIFTLAGYGPYTDNAPQNIWHATAVSAGPDNVVHLLWNNTDHRVMLWNVDSSFNFTLAGYGPYTDNYVSNDPGNLWSAAALATGPDNVSRIVWNNSDGRVMLWNVGSSFNFTLAGYGPYTDDSVGSNPAANKWSAVGVSVGPDNMTHLLWGNTDRRAMFWNVSADFTFTLAGYGPYTDDAPSSLWSAAAVATGPDGLSHLLWGNTDRRAMLWGVDSTFDFTVAGYGPYTDDAPGNLWSVTAVSAGP